MPRNTRRANKRRALSNSSRRRRGGAWKTAANEDKIPYFYNAENPSSSTRAIKIGDWQIARDAGGKYYYYNPSTQESTYNIPKNIKDYKDDIKVISTNDETGTDYYYNIKTGEIGEKGDTNIKMFGEIVPGPEASESAEVPAAESAEVPAEVSAPESAAAVPEAAAAVPEAAAAVPEAAAAVPEAAATVPESAEAAASKIGEQIKSAIQAYAKTEIDTRTNSRPIKEKSKALDKCLDGLVVFVYALMENKKDIFPNVELNVDFPFSDHEKNLKATMSTLIKEYNNKEGHNEIFKDILGEIIHNTIALISKTKKE